MSNSGDFQKAKAINPVRDRSSLDDRKLKGNLSKRVSLVSSLTFKNKDKNKSLNGVNLTDSIDYSKDAIVSKTLLNKQCGTITLFAFDAGQALSEHTAPFDAVVQVLDGVAEVIISDKPHAVCANQMIIMPANVPHALKAKKRFKMLLTMIRS